MRALVLTVGTGDMRQLEASLIRPLVKSIEDGQWQNIVLLPSLVTETFARDLRELKQDLSIEIEVLPGAGQENDADTRGDLHVVSSAGTVRKTTDPSLSFICVGFQAAAAGLSRSHTEPVNEKMRNTHSPAGDSAAFSGHS